MKITYTILTAFLVLLSCNNNQKSQEVELIKEKDSLQNLDIRHKIANANGYENWKNVSEIAFTFNVDRGENHFDRSWIWNPKTGAVSMFSAADTISYNRSQMDSLTLNIGYWLLFKWFGMKELLFRKKKMPLHQFPRTL